MIPPAQELSLSTLVTPTERGIASRVLAKTPGGMHAISTQTVSPGISGLLLRVAEAQLHLDQPAHAVPLLTKIVEKEPSCAAETTRLLEKYLEKHGDCAPAHQLLVSLYDKQGQADKAAAHRQRAQPSQGAQPLP